MWLLLSVDMVCLFVYDAYGSSFMDVFYNKPYTFSGKVFPVSSIYTLVSKHKYLPGSCYIMCTHISFTVKFKYYNVPMYVYGLVYVVFFVCVCAYNTRTIQERCTQHVVVSGLQNW